jgi:hypothetical protein
MSETEPKKTKALRALSGVSQGLHDQGISGLAGLALLPLMPAIRERAFASRTLPPQFQTKDIPALQSLLERLIDAAKYDPGKGREVGFIPTGQPGQASFIREWVSKFKDRAPRDIFQIGVGASPETVAHEVGHAAANSRAAKLLRGISLNFARTPVGTTAPSLLALSGALSPNEELPVQAKAAPYVGAGILAAILGEEARANIVGAKALEAIGKKMTTSDKLKMFLPTATNLGRAGVLIGAPIGILKGISAYNKAKQKGRDLTPLQLAGSLPSRLADLPTAEELAAKWQEKLHKSS